MWRCRGDWLRGCAGPRLLSCWVAELLDPNVRRPSPRLRGEGGPELVEGPDEGCRASVQVQMHRLFDIPLRLELPQYHLDRRRTPDRRRVVLPILQRGIDFGTDRIEHCGRLAQRGLVHACVAPRDSAHGRTATGSKVERCPSKSAITTSSTPASRSHLAPVVRRSWQLNGRTPDASTA